jgi:hypothetical protein
MRVFPSLSRFLPSVAVLICLLQLAGPAAGQDKKAAVPGLKEAEEKVLQKAEDEYRIYFKRPETVPEYWMAINFEVDVGKFDVAALLLQELLLKQPAAETDKELVRIEEVKGLSTFLRLRRVRQWSENPILEKQAEKNVETLIGRVTSALDKYLGDPERLGKFIKALDAPSVEERAYAFLQLNRSGDRAAPFLAEALRNSVGTPLHPKIVGALSRLNPEVVTPLLAMLTARDAKDARDIDLRLALLDVVKARAEATASAELWQLMALPKYPDIVRQRARETLAYLLQTTAARLPAPREALAEIADGYARHHKRYLAPRLSAEDRKAFEAKHKDQEPVAVWTWGDKGLRREITSSLEADLYHGLRFSREALQVDPGYRQAQALFVTLSIEQAYGQRLNEALQKTPPALQRLLAEIDSSLIEEVLERALTDGNAVVILGAVQGLGERGDARFGQLSANAPPRGLLRALYFPDRRVQLAAVKALVETPGAPASATAAREVEVLRRFVAADPVRKLVFLYVPEERKGALRKAAQAAGFESIFTAGLKEAFGQLHLAANIEAILIDYPAPAAELPYLLAQLRTDPDIGRLPVLLIAPPEQRRPNEKGVAVLERQQFQSNLGSLADRLHNVWVIPDGAALDGPALQERLQQFTRYATLPEGEPRPAGGSSLRLDRLTAEVKAEFSPAELKASTQTALRLLQRMAQSDSGYDLRPALPAVAHALLADDTAAPAIELLGRIPGVESQVRLASVLLDPRRAKLRLPAGVELNRNVQRYGLLLTGNPDQFRQLRALAENPAEDPALRTQAALVLGSVTATPRQTGARLNRYTPEGVAPRK